MSDDSLESPIKKDDKHEFDKFDMPISNNNIENFDKLFLEYSQIFN